MALQDLLSLASRARGMSAAARGAQGVPAGDALPGAASLQDLLLQLTGGQVNQDMLLQLLALLAGAGGVPSGAPPAAVDEGSDIAAAFLGR